MESVHVLFKHEKIKAVYVIDQFMFYTHNIKIMFCISTKVGI